MVRPHLEGWNIFGLAKLPKGAEITPLADRPDTGWIENRHFQIISNFNCEPDGGDLYKDVAALRGEHARIGRYMSKRLWTATQHFLPNSLTPSIRFAHGFPERNEWIVFGVGNLPLHPEQLVRIFNIGAQSAIDLIKKDFWFDTNDGQIQLIDPPADSSGQQPSQVLESPVWPSSDGQLYSLSDTDPDGIKDFHLIYHLMADCHDGVISKKDLSAILKSGFKHLVNISINKDSLNYLHYLSMLRKHGALVPGGHLTREAYFEKMALSKEIIKEVFGRADKDHSPVKRSFG